MDPSRPILITFAVQEEAAPFLKALRHDLMQVLVTGMGPDRARTVTGQALQRWNPSLVLTCGFAGGLNPALPSHTVVTETDPELAGLQQALCGAGAVPGRFHCSDRVIADVAGKARLFKTTGADAVEMESGVIRALCRDHSIPSATVRVISDAADEALPLDFSALMKPDYSMDYLKLAGALMKKPGKIPELMRFRKHIMACANTLAAVLAAALADRVE